MIAENEKALQIRSQLLPSPCHVISVNEEHAIMPSCIIPGLSNISSYSIHSRMYLLGGANQIYTNFDIQFIHPLCNKICFSFYVAFITIKRASNVDNILTIQINGFYAYLQFYLIWEQSTNNHQLCHLYLWGECFIK